MEHKFSLKYTDSNTNIITVEFSEVRLAEILPYMEQFLKGCGFVFDGSLDIRSFEK